MTKFDPTKPVQTRDGRPATILRHDLRNTRYPIIGLISQRDEEEPFVWDAEGKSLTSAGNSKDLVNISEKHKVWVNVWRDNDSSRVFSTIRNNQEAWDADARNAFRGSLIARKVIEITEGEGLDR